MFDYPKLRALTKEKYSPKTASLLLNNLSTREKREQKRLALQANFGELHNQLKESLLEISEVRDYYNSLLDFFTIFPSDNAKKKMLFSLGKITIFLEILVNNLKNISTINDQDTNKDKLIGYLNNLAFSNGQLSLLFQNFILDIHSTYLDGDQPTSVWEKCKLLYKDSKYRYQEVKHEQEGSKVSSALAKVTTKLQMTITSLI